MLRHGDIWRALDRLAAEQGLTPSGLARRAGLDPTTFNRSKRVTRDGKLRWPSTESVSKVLNVTQCSLSHLVILVNEGKAPSPGQTLPVIGLRIAEQGDCFDPNGMPAGTGWKRIAAPQIVDGSAFALQVLGTGLAPLYRDGDIMIVSPAASIRMGDRIIARLHAGRPVLREVARRGPGHLDLAMLTGTPSIVSVAAAELAWASRIVWVSQ